MDEKQEVKVEASQDAEIGLGIGESTQDQQPPASTVARERMVEIIANNTKVVADCEEILKILNDRPELDASFCRLFGITKTPGIRDVSK